MAEEREWADEGMNREEGTWEGKKADEQANTWGINAISSLSQLMTDSKSPQHGLKVEEKHQKD